LLAAFGGGAVFSAVGTGCFTVDFRVISKYKSGCRTNQTDSLLEQISQLIP
jgi:hypothetical protein